jgi:UDP-glucose 4-epimerase
MTGGAGYIGSHTCVELLEAGHEVFVVDNLRNGHETALERIWFITNCELQFMNADIRDTSALDIIFNVLSQIQSFILLGWRLLAKVLQSL